VLGIETPCIIAVIGIQVWGGGAPEFGTISFHFLGTDNDKIKIVGGNIIVKKTFHMWENIIVNTKFFGNQ
jgi:hypothetical protein